MKTVVVKFGGSSLADAKQMQKVADIVKSDPARRFVVVSAPGKRYSEDTKVTDMLYRCYDLAVNGEDYASELKKISSRFEDIIRELGIRFELDTELEKIRKHLESGPQRDYMASRGEYLNAKIMAEYLQFPFLDTAALVRFSADGKFEDDLTDRNLRAALAGVTHAVLPGFYGAAENETVFTFSRGGSDVTGSLIARAADAALYENWTDVSGMLFTDPRIVKDPEVISYITYRELRELSYMGASVLHEDAVFPVRKAGIPINIRNTNRPEDEGTMIVQTLPDTVRRHDVTGIAGRKGFSSVQIEKSMMNSEVGFGARLLGIFASYGVSFEHCPTGIDAMSVVVRNEQFFPKQEEILNRIREELQPEMIYVDSSLAMIAVVGAGMDSVKGLAARIFGALGEDKISIRVMDMGSSVLNLIIGVDESDFEAAIRSIYRSCVE